MAFAKTASVNEATGTGFSILDLRDQVVIMALFDQLVTEEEVEAVWRVWRTRHLAFMQEPFWRLLLLLSHTNTEQLYEQAARVAGIETAYLGRHAIFLATRNLKRQISRSDWKTLAQIPVVPVAEKGYGHASGGMIFATHDTTNPRIRKVIDSIWKAPYEMRYAPHADLLALLEEERAERLSSAEVAG